MSTELASLETQRQQITRVSTAWLFGLFVGMLTLGIFMIRGGSDAWWACGISNALILYFWYRQQKVNLALLDRLQSLEERLHDRRGA